jgi:hypothetical protein
VNFLQQCSVLTKSSGYKSPINKLARPINKLARPIRLTRHKHENTQIEEYQVLTVNRKHQTSK